MTRLLVRTTLLLATLGPPLSARQEGSQAQRAGARFSAELGEQGYNRVEGIPFMLGLVARGPGAEPFQGSGHVLLRSEPTANLDQVGFQVRGEKLFGRQHRFMIGARGYGDVMAMETRGLSTLDNSLTAVIFHQDYRDYYQRFGITGYATYAPRGKPYQIGVEFRHEKQEVLSTGTAYSIIDNNKPWRIQPLIAEGIVQSLEAGVRLDTRSGPFYARGSGWLAEASVIKNFGGDLTYPTVRTDFSDPTTVIPLPIVDASHTRGTIDVRRYNGIGNLSLNLRGYAGGALTDRPLPPQFQHALGGRGTLPGTDGLPLDPTVTTSAMDCRAREEAVFSSDISLITPSFFPQYGCDRFVLLQAQLEGYFGFRFGTDGMDIHEEGMNINLEFIPRWVVFFNAARAWALGDLGSFARTDEDWQSDIGGGIAFGDLGFFIAAPLQGEDKTPNFLVRLGTRF